MMYVKNRIIPNNIASGFHFGVFLDLFTGDLKVSIFFAYDLNDFFFRLTFRDLDLLRSVVILVGDILLCFSRVLFVNILFLKSTIGGCIVILCARLLQAITYFKWKFTMF